MPNSRHTIEKSSRAWKTRWSSANRAESVKKVKIDLKDRVAIVTGGGRGIGRSIAVKLAAEGAKVVVLDLDPSLLEATSAHFESKGWQGLGIECDVRSSDQVRSAIEETLVEYGQIDILVNNAGVSRPGTVEEQSEDDWDLTMDVNLKGV